MRKYIIKEESLGFIIKKVYEDEDGIATINLFRTGKQRDFRRSCAKVYLFKDDATSGLILAKRKLASE